MVQIEPGKKPRKKWLALLCLAAILAGGVSIFLRSDADGATSAPLKLPDGASAYLAGVTFGTNHVFGGSLNRWVEPMPPAVQKILVSILGSRAMARQSFGTATPTLVIWLNTTLAAPAPPAGLAFGWYDVYLGDKDGFVSGEDQNFNTSSSGLSPLRFSAFPRRERTLTVHLFYHDSQGKVKECTALKILNPAYREYPQWQPEALPATHRLGDLEATIDQISTGHEANMAYVSLPGGGNAMEFGTNRDEGRNQTVCRLQIRSLTDTNQEWRVVHVQTSDATGNMVESSGMMWGGAVEDVFGFNPGLWPNEDAWRMKCEIKRTKGFAPDELFGFTNVPLGAPFEKVQLNWSTNFNGVTVTLDHLIRRPPQTNNTWSSGQLSELQIQVSGLTNDLILDLLEIRSDDGTKLETPSSSIGGNTQKHYLRNIPAEANFLKLAFALHKSRSVEFLARPKMGVARFDYFDAKAPGSAK